MKISHLRCSTFGLFVLIVSVSKAISVHAQEPAPVPAPAVPENAIPNDSSKSPAAPAVSEPDANQVNELRRLAITDLGQVDADYHEQGEYVGEILIDGSRRQIGLQVVALGNGQFSGLVFRGGLPGNGFDFSARLKLLGDRSGEQVILKGDNLAVYLQSGYAAVVKNTAGDRLGFLQPVKRISPTLGAKPPEDAVILFDGQNTDQLLNAKVTADGLLDVGFETKKSFQNFTIHGEFRIPYMPHARGQDRGNSGFYLQRRYEVQVLDSFGLELQFNDCASLYKFKAPDQNMSFPPLRWQTYDIDFVGARFSPCGQKVCKATVTVRHNGVIVHNQLPLENKTGGGRPEGADALPILFQDHHNPVQYRNLWLIDRGQNGCSQSSDMVSVVPSCCVTPCTREFRHRHFHRR